MDDEALQSYHTILYTLCYPDITQNHKIVVRSELTILEFLLYQIRTTNREYKIVTNLSGF